MTEEQKLIKRDLQEACDIGEDGGMVVDGRFTVLGAYRKMVSHLREECGESEAQDFMEACKPEDLSWGFLHATTEEKREEMGLDEDCEWYVNRTGNHKHRVWVWWG